MQDSPTYQIRLADRLKLFPDSTSIQNDSLFIAGHAVAALAADHGTPLYIYDLLTLNNSVAEYHSALRKYYPATSQITYAGKAFLCKAIAEWTQKQGLFVDCTGEGEIAIALVGGVPREHIVVHGVNKSDADIQSALQNARTIVVDNLTELKNIHVILSEAKNLYPNRSETLPGTPFGPRARRGETADQPGRRQSQLTLHQSDINIWLRLLPGIEVHTHHIHTQTGQYDSKFGMTRAELREAANFCRENDLPLKGIHFHLGSNFRDPEPLIPAIELALDLAKEIGFSADWHFCPGGGWAVAYHEDELPNPSIESYVRGIAESVVEGCQARGLDLPSLHLEPGRSLIARAGIAIYRVGAVKKRGEKTWLLTDGGMADNPRFALYGVRYSCLLVAAISRESDGKASIAGPYCESGDIVIENLAMPEIHEGELIAIPVAGAYHLSMSSNYNGARRPAALMLEEGRVKLMIERETVNDLLKKNV